MTQANIKNDIVKNLQDPTSNQQATSIVAKNVQEITSSLIKNIQLIENVQRSTSIDSSLEKLISEAESLFKLLDNTSVTIRHFEKSMTELKAFFTFRLCIEREKESLPKNLTDDHKDIQWAESFNTRIRWHLAWEPLDGNSKNYRLFLISEEQEIIIINYMDNYYPKVFQSKDIFKKAFIETDIQTRLKYIEHLSDFINRFKSHLKERRLSIESNGNVASHSLARNRY